MTRMDETFEDKLARLSAETEDLLPRADFVMRVMSRLDAPRPAAVAVNQDWSMQVLRWARVGMTMATLAAVAFVFFAWDSTNAADQEEALAYGIVEAFE
jgi:hypothetical protein